MFFFQNCFFIVFFLNGININTEVETTLLRFCGTYEAFIQKESPYLRKNGKSWRTNTYFRLNVVETVLTMAHLNYKGRKNLIN